SAFAAHARQRRQLDAAWTFTALYRSLAGKGEPLPLEARLAELEDRLESAAPSVPQDGGLDKAVAGAMREAAGSLAQRLLARAEREEPGYLVLNPCSFARRVVLELAEFAAPVAVAGPVKSCQLDGGMA